MTLTFGEGHPQMKILGRVFMYLFNVVTLFSDVDINGLHQTMYIHFSQISMGDLDLLMSWSHCEPFNLHKTPSAVVFEGSYSKTQYVRIFPNFSVQ